MAKPKAVSDTEVAKAEAMFIHGLSIHQVLNQTKLSYEQAAAIQTGLADDTRKQVINHKIIVRQKLRSVVPEALATLQRYLGPDSDAELDEQEGRAKAALRIKCAQTLLQAAKDSMNDSLLTMLTEKPMAEDSDQKTLFDYKSEIDDEGATRLIVHAVNDDSE